MKHQFDSLRMRAEDADGRTLRSEAKVQALSEAKTKAEAELKFVGRRYVACLVTRQITHTRIARAKSELQRLRGLIKGHDKFVMENKIQLDMLKQLRGNMEKLQKDAEADPVEMVIETMK